MFSFITGSRKWESWKRADAGDSEALKSFLLEHENHSVPFTSRLTDESKQFDERLIGRNAVFIEKEKNRVVSAVMFTSDGIICPVFSENSLIKPLGQISRDTAFNKKRYLTLMGTGIDVRNIEELFPDRKRLSVDYDLMNALSTAVPDIIEIRLKEKITGPEGRIEIKRATAADLEILMPLRKAYEIEEVVLNPGNFNLVSCRNRFKKTIVDDAVFFAEINGIPAATCCINAEGFGWAQIGGVYTLPQQRSKGLAARIMKVLAEHTSAKGKNLTLFVKKNNAAAVRLYENCGFRKTGEYRISYLESR